MMLAPTTILTSSAEAGERSPPADARGSSSCAEQRSRSRLLVLNGSATASFRKALAQPTPQDDRPAQAGPLAFLYWASQALSTRSRSGLNS
jgi:hypothetical protein